MSIKARKKHPVIKVKGTAKYCHLNEPNKRFEPEFGTYSCDLVIDKDQADMLKNTLRPLYEEELKQVQEENEGKKIEQKEFPIKEDEGGFLVKSKLKAGGRRRDGSEYSLSIALFDSQGKPLPEDVKVWGGSKVNLAFRPRFWYTAMAGFGVSFDLQAVQVIELQNGGVSGVAADAFGFTSEEGYVANGGETLDQAFDAEESEEITANF
jgi:hypothetical protein|tara:strand:+ start:749 stop:1375 length:627 start_codon:yes stop_codon:yes gene_type:complete